MNAINENRAAAGNSHAAKFTKILRECFTTLVKTWPWFDSGFLLSVNGLTLGYLLTLPEGCLR